MKLGCFFLQFTHSLGTVWTHFAMIEYIGRSGSTPGLGEQKSTEKRHLESNVKQYVSTNIQGIICCTLWLAKDHVHDCHRRIPYSSLHFLLLIRFKALYRGRLSQMCHKKLSTLPTYFALFNNVSNIFVWVVLPCNCQVMWGLLSKLLHLMQLLCGNLIYQCWLYICPILLFPGVWECVWQSNWCLSSF